MLVPVRALYSTQGNEIASEEESWKKKGSAGFGSRGENFSSGYERAAHAGWLRARARASIRRVSFLRAAVRGFINTVFHFCARGCAWMCTSDEELDLEIGGAAFGFALFAGCSISALAGIWFMAPNSDVLVQ